MLNIMQALDKAREAARKERILCKQREQAQLTDQINLDLTYCVSGTQIHMCIGKLCTGKGLYTPMEKRACNC